MKEIAIVILAAGKGTRMKSALPKVLHPIAGKPMLHHVIESARAAKASRIVVVLSPEAKEIEASIAAAYKDVKIAIQKQPLGTGHAVLAAENALKGFKGAMLVAFGDTPFIRPETFHLIAGALSQNNVAVLGFTPPDPADYGRLVVKNSQLEAIVEAKEATPQQKKIGLCNSGVMGLKAPEIWPLLKKIKAANSKKEYYLTDIVGIVRGAKGSAAVVEGCAEEVLGINSQSQLADAEALMQRTLREKALANGVRMMDPGSVFLMSDTQFGMGVVIQPFVVFGPGVAIGDNVEIRSFSHIEQAKIGSGSRVGPFARIRPGTVTAESVHIGNFVEIKNAKLAKGAKVNHLSYVGDASVGEEANIGAGTITCNYDGVNKHKTDIGAGAFIGSNTSLVAPVKVGGGAIVAAGSTVTKNVAANALMKNEMPQFQEPGGASRLRKKSRKKP